MGLDYADKRKFVHQLMDLMKEKILLSVESMPEDWDGIELRQYIADKFQEQTRPLDRKRKRKYNNEVLVRNL